MSENERRRLTAHEMWLQQLTPQERGQYELDHAGEVMEASPEVLAAMEALPDAVPKLQELAARERRFTRVSEPREALQRAIERRG